MILSIGVPATTNYQYALLPQARYIAANLNWAERKYKFDKKYLIVVTDDKTETEKLKEIYLNIIPDIELLHSKIKLDDNHNKNYSNQAQYIIATIKGKMYELGRFLKSNLFWSLDSDTLPWKNNLGCMMDILNFDEGYYSIATCAYPTNGGAPLLLFGAGDKYRPIYPDVFPDERIVPEELTAKIKRLETVKPEKRKDKWHKKMGSYQKEIEKCPPKGNVFELNGKKYHKRGWSAYYMPDAGKGMIVPTSWCGLGNTLLNEEALSCTSFEGYGLGGTEDLYVVWKRWNQFNLRIAEVAHCICDHVVRKDGKLFISHFDHETDKGDRENHFNFELTPYYRFDGGDELTNSKIKDEPLFKP